MTTERPASRCPTNGDSYTNNFIRTTMDDSVVGSG
jgi:hypothetical protein